jgi:tetratricopeptide (TPR) repeat protein
VDPEVLQLYARGVRSYDRRTRDGAVEALSALSEAIRRDSSFAPAWNVLAKTYARAFQRGFKLPDVANDRLVPLAVAAVRHSLDIDDSNADAWTTQGIVSHQIDPTDPETALRSIRRALELDSSIATTWHQYAIMNADKGDLTAAIDGWRRSVRIDPRYTQGLSFLALGHYWRGQYDSAAVWADSAVHVDPTYALAHQTSTLFEIERQRFDVAQARADAAVRLSEDIEAVHALANRALVKARAGNPHIASAELLGAEVTAARFAPLMAHTAVYLAEVHAARGHAQGVRHVRDPGRHALPVTPSLQPDLRAGRERRAFPGTAAHSPAGARHALLAAIRRRRIYQPRRSARRSARCCR